ncbi:Asp-tRNA(Asn)/Glu-tRNA(Gln) amidotransferase GatCAB subunit B, partial [Limosilactobacillus fermentum]|nr:Asp-tRNA(Asn)/Glu-tRNA(Gln) amidotransferase GatCAB subunit B [Limosilactobacillus fermentum]
IMAALALHAEVTKKMHFDRKNYFYPDNPKAYQITQSETPIAHDGWEEIEVAGKKQKIGTKAMHIEEDVGKNTNSGRHSYVDLNRPVTPLIYLVSYPYLASPQ